MLPLVFLIIYLLQMYIQREDYKFIQNTLRRRIQMAMLANIGVEFRTEKDGIFYIGASLHRPWDDRKNLS